MGGAKKNVGNSEQTFSGPMEPIRGESVAWRLRYLLKTSESHAKSARVAECRSWISHFRPCSFWTAGTPGLPRATGNDGPG